MATSSNILSRLNFGEITPNGWINIGGVLCWAAVLSFFASKGADGTVESLFIAAITFAVLVSAMVLAIDASNREE